MHEQHLAIGDYPKLTAELICGWDEGGRRYGILLEDKQPDGEGRHLTFYVSLDTFLSIGQKISAVSASLDPAVTIEALRAKLAEANDLYGQKVR